MRKSELMLAVLTALIAAPADAKQACPKRSPGDSYPWSTQGRMSGDQWAKMDIDIDAQGRVADCRVRASNVDVETRFLMCRAMRRGFQPEPPENGAAVGPRTVQASFLLAGPAHRRADEAARKRFFAEHPGERPECYPR